MPEVADDIFTENGGHFEFYSPGQCILNRFNASIIFPMYGNIYLDIKLILIPSPIPKLQVIAMSCLVVRVAILNMALLAYVINQLKSGIYYFKWSHSIHHVLKTGFRYKNNLLSLITSKFMTIFIDLYQNMAAILNFGHVYNVIEYFNASIKFPMYENIGLVILDT